MCREFVTNVTLLSSLIQVLYLFFSQLRQSKSKSNFITSKISCLTIMYHLCDMKTMLRTAEGRKDFFLVRIYQLEIIKHHILCKIARSPFGDEEEQTSNVNARERERLRRAVMIRSSSEVQCEFQQLS